MLSVLKKEISTFFNSLTGYIIMMLFLLGVGMFMWVFSPTVFDLKVADMSLLFEVSPYVLMFVIPAITMKMLAEERKTGTLEWLLTKPLSEWKLVMGKYLSALVLVIMALIPTIVFYFSIYQLGETQGNIDSSAVLGSYLALVLLSSVFTAIGVFCSSSTENQVVAFIGGVFLNFFLFSWMGYISELISSTDLAYLVQQLGLESHYYAISVGVVDTRNVIFLLSVAGLFLALTKMMLTKRKW